MQSVTLQEADWRKRQIESLRKQFREYREVADKCSFNFKSQHTKGKLNNIEMNFMITVFLVHRTFIKAWTQYGLAINVGDREAAQQAHHFIELLTNWFTLYNPNDPKIDLMAEVPGIKDMIANPQLIYYETIKK